MAAKRKTREDEWPRLFLENLATGRSVTASARAAGVTRDAAYKLAERDEDFATAWQDAQEEAVDYIRDEVYRRAVTGYEEPVFHAGKSVGTVRRFSDTLLIFEAKRRDPAYRERFQVEASGTVRHDLMVTLSDGRQPIEVEGTTRRAAARALESGNGDGSQDTS